MALMAGGDVPAGAREALSKALKAKESGGPFRVSSAQAVLDLDPDAGSFAKAKPVAWRFLLSGPKGAVTSAEVARKGRRGFHVSHFRSGPSVQSLVKTVGRLKRVKSIVSVRIPELSLAALRVPQLGVLPLAPAGLVRGTDTRKPWLSESEFFARVASLRSELTRAKSHAAYREAPRRRRSESTTRVARAPGGESAGRPNGSRGVPGKLTR